MSFSILNTVSSETTKNTQKYSVSSSTSHYRKSKNNGWYIIRVPNSNILLTEARNGSDLRRPTAIYSKQRLRSKTTVQSPLRS